MSSDAKSFCECGTELIIPQGFVREALSVPFRNAVTCSAIAIALSASASAFVQQARADVTAATAQTEGNTKLEDIVVTARKRPESIDTVPLAITAITSDKIEELNLKSIEDVSSFSPGFYLQSQTGTGAGRNDRSFSQLTFRGVGANTANISVFAGGEAFLDGAPVLNSSLSDVQDVERVEVLRGPQCAARAPRQAAGLDDRKPVKFAAAFSAATVRWLSAL